jgi:hypothetical protein
MLLGMLFVAVGCAHQSQQRASTAHVVVTTSPEAARQFGAAAFERIVESEVRPATFPVRPMTITVRMDSTDELTVGPKVGLQSGKKIYWRTVFEGSGEAVQAGADHHSFDPPRHVPASRGKFGMPVVVGSYTISDEAGTVCELEPIVMLSANLESHSTLTQLQSMRAAAQYLAVRVVTVEAATRKTAGSSRRTW